MFIGSLAWSTLSDRIGRKPAFMWTVLIYSVGSGLSGLAPTYPLLLAVRVLTGLGLGGEIPIANTLVAEFVPARVRGRVMAVIANMFPCGWVLASLAGIFVGIPYGWRALYFLGLAPAVLCFFISRWIPESVRYLLGRGDVDAANKVLGRIGAPPASTDTVVRGEDVEVGTVPRFTELYSKPYRQRTAVLSTVLFLGFFVAYGFGGWMPSLLIGPPYNLPAAIVQLRPSDQPWGDRYQCVNSGVDRPTWQKIDYINILCTKRGDLSDIWPAEPESELRSIPGLRFPFRRLVQWREQRNNNLGNRNLSH